MLSGYIRVICILHNRPECLTFINFHGLVECHFLLYVFAYNPTSYYRCTYMLQLYCIYVQRQDMCRGLISSSQYSNFNISNTK